MLRFVDSRVARLVVVALAFGLGAPLVGTGPAAAASTGGGSVDSVGWNCPFGGPTLPLDPNSHYFH
jgi:hypothetical protein